MEQNIDYNVSANVKGKKMNFIITVDHKGIEYDSQKEMCDAYNVPQTTFCKRMERGWELKEALEGKIYYSKDGVDYKTQNELCEAYGIHPNSFRRKLNAGMSIEDILEKKPFMRIEGPDGKKYANTEEMCKDYDIKVCTFRKRMETYQSKIEALTNPDQRGRHKHERKS